MTGLVRLDVGLGMYAKNADPVQTPQNVVSDQSLHCLLTGFSMQNMGKSENIHKKPLKMRNGLTQMIRMDDPTGQGSG